jgi:hypothetical protein
MATWRGALTIVAFIEFTTRKAQLMGVRFLPVLFASIALTAACGPRCLYWWDATGKKRDERIAVVDSKTCHLDEAYRMKDFLAQDHAYDQMLDCMKRHGWVVSDRICPPNER